MIELRGLRLSGLCGLLPEERERRQPLEFDVDLYLDARRAAQTDDLANTVDYGAVCDFVASTLEAESFLLLERLADRLASELAGWPGVIEVEVVAKKLRPPVPYQMASSGVRVRRGADSGERS